MNVVKYTLVDQDNDNDIGAAGGDLVNGLDVTDSYPGDTVTLNVPGVGNVTYTGITFYLAGGGRVFTPTDGQVLEAGTLVGTSWVSGQAPLDVADLGPPCFAAGTMIRTPQGERAVEALKAGDRVLLQSGTSQEILWTGAKTVDASESFAPIRFETGAVGNDAPLYLSPNHRVLLTGWRAELMMGASEIFVAAKHLVNGTKICIEPRRAITYHHLLLEDHAVIVSNGALTESLFLGDMVLGAESDTREELVALYPELVDRAERAAWKAALPVVKAYEAEVLLAA